MFQQIDNCVNSDETYIVMGQICIDKQFRKQGVFRGLYHFMKHEMSSRYNMIITEVDVANTRSINAHFAIGFKALYSYRSNNQNWKILYLNLKN
jgi:predicted GNAT superfamily acetyltransferase